MLRMRCSATIDDIAAALADLVYRRRKFEFGELTIEVAPENILTRWAG